MHTFFFSRQHTDLDSDLRENEQELQERWDEINRERRQIKKERKQNQQRHDTVQTARELQELEDWEEASELREKELIREDRLLEAEYLRRVISRLSPGDSSTPATKAKLEARLRELSSQL